MKNFSDKEIDSKQSHCLGGRHYSQTVNQNEYENLNSKSQKAVKIVKGSCSLCDRKESQIITE